VHEFHYDGQGLVDDLVTDAGAEVTEVILAWDMGVQASQLPVATPFVRLEQITTEAGVIDVMIHFGGDLQQDQARRVVAAVAAGAIVGGTERAGEAEVKRRSNKPTKATFDVALTC